MKTYEQMHSGLHWARGKAAEYKCIGCPETAEDWAYRYTAKEGQEITDSRGRKYSENFEDYEPMCRSCHRRFDMLQPERREKQLEHLKRINAKAAEDPNYSQLMRERALKGAEAIRALKASGADLGKRSPEGLKELGKMVGNLRRKCDDCGMETAAGALGRHQKITGHSGWTAA